MRHGDFSHQRQAEARATGAIGHERLEETRQYLQSDPTPGITDPQEQMRAVRVCSDAHHSAAWRML
jgi:hypothetical protein